MASVLDDTWRSLPPATHGGATEGMTTTGTLAPGQHAPEAAFPPMTPTFAPDERPPEPTIETLIHTGEGYEVVRKGEAGSPFTPEQEARLRQIAWGACVAYGEFARQRLAGVPKHADETRRAFLEGGP